MNTLHLPPIGLGTWDLRGRACRRTVREALDMGYRHVDTAEMYENETEVGLGFQDADLTREDVFLTTKLWTNHLTRSAVAETAERSLKRLRTDYVDLLLIHWPNPEVPLSETLAAMVEVMEQGKARAIGVSNFPPALWREALDLAPVPVNQVEYHPFLGQGELLRFARERKLKLVAYTPLAKGSVADEKTILDIARAVGRTPAQVSLRWLIQQPRVAAIPKTSRTAHLRENLNVDDFELNDAQMDAIFSLARGHRLVNPGSAPDW